MKIIKGNNTATLIKHVTQDKKKISSRTENNACNLYTRSGRVYGKIFGTFFKVCKMYQFVYIPVHILEKYYVCKVSKQRVQELSTKRHILP